jgi:putative aminopeptidase FrvX
VITDPAFQLYLGDKGYVIAGLSIPHRYSHASIQMCHETDIARTIQLVEATGKSFTPEVDITRG